MRRIWKEFSKTNFPIYCWFFQVVLVLGMASVVIWPSLVPKSPLFTIVSIQFPVTDGGYSTVHYEIIQNTSLIFLLQISNPNKGISIYYNNINLALYQDKATLGTNTVPGFYQGHKKSVIYNTPFDNGDQFQRGIDSGIDDLRLCLDTTVRYKIFWWKTKHRLMGLEASVRVDSQGRIYGDRNVKLHTT
ncbi:hypothetical protein NMG60_11022429 [Bertholletia excelsa]